MLRCLCDLCAFVGFVWSCCLCAARLPPRLRMRSDRKATTPMESTRLTVRAVTRRDRGGLPGRKYTRASVDRRSRWDIGLSRGLGAMAITEFDLPGAFRSAPSPTPRRREIGHRGGADRLSRKFRLGRCHRELGGLGESGRCRNGDQLGSTTTVRFPDRRRPERSLGFPGESISRASALAAGTR